MGVISDNWSRLEITSNTLPSVNHYTKKFNIVALYLLPVAAITGECFTGHIINWVVVYSAEMILE